VGNFLKEKRLQKFDLHRRFGQIVDVALEKVKK